MNILVTGGAGFIGSHIVDRYLEAGHRVTIIDNLSTGKPENINPAAEFHHVDIRDADRVKAVFRAGTFDVLNHHAAQIDVRKSVADPAHDCSVNILGMLNLLECCVAHGVRQVIFASSGGVVYGEQEHFPADEGHPTRPISPYGVAKLATEQYLYYYRVVHGINSVSLRYANIYGPRQNPEGEAGVVAIFATKMLRREQPIINGDGKQTRDYVFVGDVVKANMLVLNVNGSEVFNIGTGKETDVVEIFTILRKHTGSSAPAVHGPAKLGEQLRSVLSAQKITRALGWKPQVDLDTGLSMTVEYFRRSNT